MQAGAEQDSVVGNVHLALDCVQSDWSTFDPLSASWQAVGRDRVPVGLFKELHVIEHSPHSSGWQVYTLHSGF